MEAQLSLFEIKTNENQVAVADIRTEKQQNKNIAYDVGEKISFSRKELAALKKAFEENQNQETLEALENHNEGLALEMVTKSALIKSFTVESEIECGVEPMVIRFKQLVLQRIDPKPSINSKENRLTYMLAVQYVLSELNKVYTYNDISTFYTSMRAFYRTDQKYKILGQRFVNFCKKYSSYLSTVDTASKVITYEDLLSSKQPKPQKKKKPHLVWERTLPERPDRIGGRPSSVEKPEDLITLHGLRGVQYGHYVSDEKGLEHLIRSSEALMDLADILEVDCSALSLNGSLAIAFGARGKGRAWAHYEPVERVINMTKDKGCLGVLSHEYFHFLDHHLFNLSHSTINNIGYASEYSSLGNQLPEKIRQLFKELQTAMTEGKSITYIENTNKPGTIWNGTLFKKIYKKYNGDLYQAMQYYCGDENQQLTDLLNHYERIGYGEKYVDKARKQTQRNIKRFANALAWYHEQVTGERVDRIPYPSDRTAFYQASLVLDRGAEGKYWTKVYEMAARSFEAYIQDKLTSMRRRNDYLVTGTHDAAAYPMGEEREKINEIFDRLFHLIRKEGIL